HIAHYSFYSYALADLQAVYAGGTENLITNFNSDVVSYYFIADSAHLGGTANIRATTGSPAASVSIKLRDAASDLATGIGTAMAAITLPGAGQYAFVEVTVASAPGAPADQEGSRIYTITILGSTSGLVKWTATVSNPPYPVTSVIMFDKSSPQVAVTMADVGDATVFTVWTLPEASYTPATFVVSMDNGGVSYSTKAISPSSAELASRNVALDLTGVVPRGRTISNVAELLALSKPENRTESWSVIADIVLPGATWVGPTGFTGKLYGNGHTIDLPLSKTSGSVAMFETVGPGAGIYDLTLNVHTPAEGGQLIGPTPLSFGGFVGTISGAASPAITLENLKVTGSVVFTKVTNSYMVMGGMIGNLNYQPGGNQTVSIRHCVSGLNITFNLDNTSTGHSDGHTWEIGGFVGEYSGSNVVISDCYSTGSINLNFDADMNRGFGGLNVGGFVALQRNNSAGQAIRIERCYTTAEVVVSCGANGGAYKQPMYVGGFAGRYLSTYPSCGISSCVTLGPAVSVTWANGGTINTGRIVGYSTTNLSDNYAVSSTAGDGSLTSKEGLGVLSPSDVPWAALGYTEANGWDASVTPPVLK
ncbi:MAG: hypothetical protein LBS82_04310, partial [Spirochaetaceae bacterium]|nr:hypothetical protein [Spirochaetaceae bacterium]